MPAILDDFVGGTGQNVVPISRRRSTFRPGAAQLSAQATLRRPTRRKWLKSRIHFRDVILSSVRYATKTASESGEVRKSGLWGSAAPESKFAGTRSEYCLGGRRIRCGDPEVLG
jgi:hypothetical protein